jgi:DNA helicase-2/ATP-dependent DNA helicase PcrA
MDYLNKLNLKQREAATHKKGPLLILAGAGSGKTSTMTHRIAWLVLEEDISPYNILAVTFTNKAAAEMRERVEALIGEGSRMWILTFHSACLRILRKSAELLGYTNSFVVYDPSDQKTVIKKCVKEAQIDDKKFTPAYVLSVISDAKESDTSPDDYNKMHQYSYPEGIIGQLYTAYDKELRKNNAMDFDDLILNTVRLFRSFPDVLAQYQDRFDYIMVDEYQDTNTMQYNFISMMAKAHNNICVVGDDDQCIYQWRGADINNILDFENDFSGAKVIKLEQNYRSHGNILACAHSVIENNKTRKNKKLWTDKSDGEKITYYAAGTEREEASYIAGEISKLLDEYGKYSNFAILYRTNAQSRTFEEALSSQDLPYRVLGGLRYYDRKEIKDILSYMRLVQNPSDDVSFTRIINEPKRGIGGKTLEKIGAIATFKGMSLFHAIQYEEILENLSDKASLALRSFIELINELAGEAENLRISDIYETILLKTGYIAMLDKQPGVESESRIENLMEFVSVIKEYEKEDPNITLAEFMEKIALLADIDNHDAGENAVVLMTMHSAKGLEFPVVFMPGMEEGLFPGWRSLEKPEGIEEERRLCYVGMTRAMKKLYLTRAYERTLYGKTDFTMESTFLKEMDKNYLDGHDVRGKGIKLFHTPETGNDGYASKEIFRPFDQLKYVKASLEQKSPAGDGLKLENGDKVRHSKFGEGIVLEADEKTVTAVFDKYGVKKLSRIYAPIEKI